MKNSDAPAVKRETEEEWGQAGEELDAIEIESTHTIEIDSFVPRAQIDQRFFDTPYYITPNEPVGQQAFAVIREAMRGKRMVALGPIARLRSSSLRHGHSRSATVIRSCWKSRNACPLCHSLAKAWSIGRSLSADGPRGSQAARARLAGRDPVKHSLQHPRTVWSRRRRGAQ